MSLLLISRTTSPVQFEQAITEEGDNHQDLIIINSSNILKKKSKKKVIKKLQKY